MTDGAHANLLELTVELVAAFVSNNSVSRNDLPGLIHSTYGALAALGASATDQVEEEKEEFPPAVSVRRSLESPNHIISMIDGKPYKSLRRHLGARDLTPAQYRARYNLPDDYPIVAPAYSEQRREIARNMALGRHARAGGRGGKDD